MFGFPGNSSGVEVRRSIAKEFLGSFQEILRSRGSRFLLCCFSADTLGLGVAWMVLAGISSEMGSSGGSLDCWNVLSCKAGCFSNDQIILPRRPAGSLHFASTFIM